MPLRTFFAFLPLFCAAHASAKAETSFPPVQLSEKIIQATHLTYATAHTGTVAHMLPAMSRVQADATHTVTLQPAGSGKVLAIMVLPGQSVQKGQALLQYQNHSLHIARLQETQTRTALAAARATEQEATQAYARARALSGQTVSAGEAQKRLATLQQAKEAVAVHEAELAVLKHRFDEEYTSPTEIHASQDETSTLVAPFAGTITRMTTAIAADVEPTSPLLTLSDTQHVWIVSDIAPQDASLIVPAGLETTFLPDQTHPPLTGRIETVGTVTDPATGLVQVVSMADNTQALLRPGMVLNSLLQTTQSQTGITLPAESVQTLDGQTVVFVKTAENTVRPTPVQLGLEDGHDVVVLSGLQTGTQVVQHGSLAVKGMITLPAMDAD